MTDIELARELNALVTSDAFKTTSKKGIIHIAMATGMNHELSSQCNIVIANSMGQLHAVYWGQEDAGELYSQTSANWVETYLLGYIQGVRRALHD